MQAGSELIKVRSNSRQYHRIFSLNADMTEIRWQPTSKKPHKARSKCTQITKQTILQGTHSSVMRKGTLFQSGPILDFSKLKQFAYGNF